MRTDHLDEIISRFNLSSYDLVSRIESPDEIQRLDLPACLTGVAGNWPASKKWSFDYLNKKLGDISIIVSERRGDQKTHFASNLSGLIEKISNGPHNPLYSSFSDHLRTELVDDYQVPQFFRCDYKRLPQSEQTLVLSWIYLGSKNSWTELHTDVHSTSAWNVVFRGLKLWMFFPPEQQQFLYNGEVNPFQPDLSRYPLFRYARPVLCLQNPLEMVYTPSRWWHAVFNIESGFALTENFINYSNIDNVYQDLSRVLSHKGLEKLEHIRALGR